MMYDKFLHVDIRIEDTGVIKEQRVEEVKVLAENRLYICLDNLTYTKLTKDKKSKHEHYPDRIEIDKHSKNSMWFKYMGFIHIVVYSTKSLRVTENRINKELKNFIEAELCFMRGVENINIQLKPQTQR